MTSFISLLPRRAVLCAAPLFFYYFFLSNTSYQVPAMELPLYAARTTTRTTNYTPTPNPHVCTGCMRGKLRTMHNSNASRSLHPENTTSYHEDPRRMSINRPSIPASAVRPSPQSTRLASSGS